MSTYKTKAIVLKENDCLEADRLFYIYTESRGKVQIKIKGGKKIKSKLISHVQPFLITNLLIAKGKNYDLLASSQIWQDFPNIKNDFAKIIIAYNFLELVDQLTKTYQADKKIFLLMTDYLTLLDQENLSSIQLKDILSFFTLKLFDLLGYSPELYNCLYCKKKIIPDGNFFNPKKGGLVCADCQKQKSVEGLKISDNAIKILRLAVKESASQLMKIKIDQDLSTEIENIAEEFLKFHLDKELKSRKFLECSKE